MKAWKITPIYQKTAFWIFNFLILFAALNVFIVGFEKTSTILKQSNLVSQKYGDQLHLAYPNYTPSEIQKLLNETWRERPFIYEPYTEFKERPVAGNYVHVSENGFRYVKNQGHWPPDWSNLNIFVFGGSTTFNYGVADQETIASQLQEILSTVSGKTRVSIYNFGRGYYYSTQERILFEQLLLAGHIPDAAIFIDGINEIQNIYPGHYFAGTFRGFLDRSALEEIVLLFHALPLTGTLKTAFQPYIRTREMKKLTSMKRENVREPLEVIRDIANRYLRSKKIIESIAKSYGVQAVFVWQPSPHYQYDLKNDPFFKPDPILDPISIEVYNLVSNFEKKGIFGKNFLYLGDMQKEKKKLLYVDQVHYTAEMSRELAKIIAQLLLERELLPKRLNRGPIDLVETILDAK